MYIKISRDAIFFNSILLPLILTLTSYFSPFIFQIFFFAFYYALVSCLCLFFCSLPVQFDQLFCFLMPFMIDSLATVKYLLYMYD